MGEHRPGRRVDTGAMEDVEALGSTAARQRTGDTTESSESWSDAQNSDDLSYLNAPKLPLLRLFWYFFYNFGLFAWGGPVAQVALIKQKVVVEENWITIARFQRVFAVYQILPGPVATELCMFFGCLSSGRIGGVVAGFGFILPGFISMLVASYLYTLASLEDKYFNASFRALQPIVVAMVFKAGHTIAEYSLIKYSTKRVDPFLVTAAICTAINYALHINIFISFGLYGILYMLISRRLWIVAGILFLLQYIVYGIYVTFRGAPSPVSLALGIAKTPSISNLFLLGLVVGTLSFGGSYTAIPLVYAEVVLKGGWLSQNVFIDCIALSSVLPAPLTIFVTFIGFQGGLINGGLGHAFAGAIVITISTLFPCFLFTVAGHSFLEKLVHNKFLASFFDGLCGSVVGVIAVIGFQLLRSSIHGRSSETFTATGHSLFEKSAQSGIVAVLFTIALGVLYKSSNKWTIMVLLVSGAVAGQFLFLHELASH